jgi:hypothetical protein
MMGDHATNARSMRGEMKRHVRVFSAIGIPLVLGMRSPVLEGPVDRRPWLRNLMMVCPDRIGIAWEKLYSPIPIDSSSDVSFILEHIMNNGLATGFIQWQATITQGKRRDDERTHEHACDFARTHRASGDA